MPRDFPFLFSSVLRPLSGVYQRIAEFRRTWYTHHPDRRRRLSAPVISVGNLVMGGSGKTPAVDAIARMLIEAGERPAILSRGYARKHMQEGVVVVSAGRGVLVPVEESGDEPQLLARSVDGAAVLVCADRYLAGRLAEQRFQTTVHLLDDGFQHVQLDRDVDLLLIGGEDLDERLLPSGRLREPLAAVEAADALLLPETDAERVISAFPNKRAFRLRQRHHPPCAIQPFGEPLAVPQAHRVVAVTGIARPSRFFESLRASGWQIVREMTYRDHHWYTNRDLDTIQAAARQEDANLILTTAKDAVRLTGGFNVRLLERSPAIRWAYIPMQLEIEPRDVFSDWLRQRLAAARSGAPEAA